MPSASWLNGWVAGDIVTATEYRKSMGAVFDQTLGIATASIDTLAVIPTTYAHLRVEAILRGDTAALNTSVQMRLNNDSAANYFDQFVQGAAATASAGETLTATSLAIGAMPASTAVANYAVSLVIDIPGYAGTTFTKAAVATMHLLWGSGTGAHATRIGGGTWASTAAINRVTLIPAAGNFIAGSRMTVYVMGS